MTASEINRRAALVFGIAIPLLHACRWCLWGGWPPARTLPINFDAFVSGAILIAGALGRAAWREALIACGWGFAAGLGYRSLFEQLADASRHAGHEVLVMSVKAVMLVVAALGMIASVRIAKSRHAV
jgi:hypothetical protein